MVEDGEGVGDDRTVTGPDGGGLLRVGERVQPVEGVEVGAELAVGVGHDGGPAAEDGVAGEDDPLGGQQERQRVGRVAGRPDHVHLEPVDRDHVAVAEPLGPEPVGRVERTDAAPHPLREGAGGLGVVGVVVGEQDGGDLTGSLRDRIEVDQHLRARVDHEGPARPGLAQHPGVGAVQSHDVRVRRQHAATALAERAARPARGGVGVGHDAPSGSARRRRATRGRSRSGIESVQPSPSGSTVGMNIVAVRPRASAITASQSACSPMSRQVR